ncbi:hypothetical protein BC941DRAFT_409644 [Chlamydoabsidia padenii]|nr:hypothetical protein BC941DRAFT_409644 [Chlamydoabsidia padenii]
MKLWICTKSWLLALVMTFFLGNLIFWSYHPRPSCEQLGTCHSEEDYEYDRHQQDFPPPPPPPPQQPDIVDKQPPPPPPPSPQPEPHADLIAQGQIEANLQDVQFPAMVEAPKQPDTYLPDTHTDLAIDLNTVAPTADKTTLRFNNEQKSISYSKGAESWQLGVINSKPDVFIASDGHFPSIVNHYNREHRIYSLMKWILRVHRRDPDRSTPLVMIDAGSNHGLFSMVAGASGAHAIAFEPQTHLRSVINFGIRANQISDRVRVLPFAVLDGYRELHMSGFEVDDGGVGSLDYNNANSAINTQTIRLDAIPSYDLLYTFQQARSTQKTLMYPEELGGEYAAALKRGLEQEKQGHDTAKVMPEHVSFRHPIHFLKIDVEGFELHALESASKLFGAGLVENAVLEFGPPNRWDVTFDEQGLDVAEKRRRSVAQCKRVVRQMIDQYGFDVYVLPSIGWANTIQFLAKHGVDFDPHGDHKNKLVHRLKSYDFDGKPVEHDEFEQEMKAKDNVITEYVPLPHHLMEQYMEELESIGEVYLWFAKRASPLTKVILAQGSL